MAALRGLPRREMKVLGSRRVRDGTEGTARDSDCVRLVKKKGIGLVCAAAERSVRNLECRVAQNRLKRVAHSHESREPLLQLCVAGTLANFNGGAVEHRLRLGQQPFDFIAGGVGHSWPVAKEKPPR